MPKVPTIDTSGRVGISTPQPIQARFAPVVSPQVKKAQTAFKESVNQLNKIEKFSQQSQADIDFFDKSSMVTQDALNDPDSSMENSQKYFDKIDQATSESLSSIADPLQRQSYVSVLNTKGLVAKKKILQNNQKKIVTKGRNTFFTNLDRMDSEYVNLVSPEERKSYLSERANLIDEAVGTLLISAKDAERLRQDGTENLEFARALKDGEVDPDFALQGAVNGDYEVGKNKSTLINNLKNMKSVFSEKEKIRITNVQTKSENEMLGIITSNEMPIGDKIIMVNQKGLEGVISPEFQGKAIKYLNSVKKENAVTDNEKYLDIIENMIDFSVASFSTADKKKGKIKSKKDAVDFLNEMRTIREKMMDFQSKGLLDDQDLKSLNKSFNTSPVVKALTLSTEKVATGSVFGIGSLYDDMEHALVSFKDTYPDDKYLQGLAIRNYFYSVKGKDVDGKKRNEVVQKIKANINQIKIDGILRTQKKAKKKKTKNFSHLWS